MPLNGGGSDTTVFLVGRELCLFMTLDASKAPGKQRKEFAALAVRRAAPFPDPDFDIAWSPDGSAALWYWSRARVNALAAAEPGRRKRFVAEALYAGSPLEQGVELLQLDDGVEARAWKAGRLCASRWWQGLPSAGQWRDFVRGTGQALDPALPLPEPLAVMLADTPWNRQATGTDKLQLSGLEQYLPKAAFVLVAIFLLVTGAQLGGIVRAQVDIWRAQSTASDLDAPLQRILDARDAADQAVAEIDSMLSLHGLRPSTSLMAELVRLLPGKEWQVRKWNQPTPDTLEVNVIAPGSNPETLVSSLEDSPMFKGVTAELGRNNELTIKATITAASTAGNDTP